MGWLRLARSLASRSNRFKVEPSMLNSREDFDGDVATEARIRRPVNAPHPTATEKADNFVRADARTRLEVRIVAAVFELTGNFVPQRTFQRPARKQRVFFRAQLEELAHLVGKHRIPLARLLDEAQALLHRPAQSRIEELIDFGEFFSTNHGIGRRCESLPARRLGAAGRNSYKYCWRGGSGLPTHRL